MRLRQSVPHCWKFADLIEMLIRRAVHCPPAVDTAAMALPWHTSWRDMSWHCIWQQRYHERRFGCWALQPWMHRPTRQHCMSKGQCCCCFTSCSGAGKQGWPKGPSGHLAAWSKAMWICRQRLSLRSAAILCSAAIGDVNLSAQADLLNH